jgi:hypothetical protein
MAEDSAASDFKTRIEFQDSNSLLLLPDGVDSKAMEPQGPGYDARFMADRKARTWATHRESLETFAKAVTAPVLLLGFGSALAWAFAGFKRADQ